MEAGTRRPRISNLSSVICLLILTVCRVFGQATRNIDWEAYENGDMGEYPQKSYMTTDITAPYIHVTQWSDECDSEDYILLSPGGNRVAGNRLLIVDGEGHLVWHHRERGSVESVQVQQFKGNNYLTFWVGDDGFFGHGAGYFKMLDESYSLAYVIDAGPGLDGDYHEFTITPDETALVTSWAKIPWDLTHKGRENGYIWNYLFQEIDIETGDVLTAWSAIECFNLTDMTVDSWQTWTGTEDDPWDWMHVNSVSKDSKGNYLISARYTNGVSYIDGTTMQALWTLGGKTNKFVELSGGNATRFVDPHMARWTDETHTTISVFDNIAFFSYDSPKRQSKGVSVYINEERGFSKLVHEFLHPEAIYAEAEGSMQKLDNGNYFIGYGSASVYAEFSANGTMLCNTHYAPIYAKSKDGAPKPGPVRSYRTYKHKWVGHPEHHPDVKIADQAIYVTWNGATRLRRWKLDARGPADNFWTTVGVFDKTGFETAMEIPRDDSAGFQLTALDAKGERIRAWHVRYDGQLTELYQDAVAPGQRLSQRLPTVAVIIICLALLASLNRRFVTRGF